MRLNLKMLVLFVSFSLLQTNEIKTWTFGVPGIWWSAEDVENLGHLVTDPLSVKNRWVAYGTGWAMIVGTAYATQDYWYHPIINYLKKRDCPCMVQHGKDSKKDDGGLADFTKSKARIYKPGDIKLRLKDVAGLEAAKLDVFDIMQFLKNPKMYIDMGAKIPKGVLLQGPPGNGKTLLAKAIAGEVECPFISVCASEFIEMFVGAGAARVRDLFAKAKELAPCIIFFDEFDAIGKKRSSHSFGGGDEQAQTLGQLLTLMDGFDMQKHPIIILAATNRAEVLDPAVLRPGRFDRIVEVGLPEIKDRIEILKVHLSSIKKSDNIDVPLIARATGGFSGAKLANLINEAAILAVNDNSSCVNMGHVELAFDHITLGREIKGMERDNADRWTTAIHEAGHAIGWLFGNNARYAIHKASIVPRSTSLGVIWAILIHESHKFTEDDLKAKIVMMLCGGLAEQEFGFGKSTGPSSDLAQARSLAYDMVIRYGMSEELNYVSYDEIDDKLPNDIATEVHKTVQRIIDDCYVIAKRLIVDHRNDIEKIASLLMTKGTVMGDEIYNLVGLPLPDVVFNFAK